MTVQRKPVLRSESLEAGWQPGHLEQKHFTVTCGANCFYCGHFSRKTEKRPMWDRTGSTLSSVRRGGGNRAGLPCPEGPDSVIVQSTFRTAELSEPPRPNHFRRDNHIAVATVATTAAETYRYRLNIFTGWMKPLHELWDKYNYYHFFFLF